MRNLFIAFALFATSAFAASWKSEGPYMGNVVSIAVDPSNGNRIWVGTHGGGVWQSSDGGGSWQLAGRELSDRVITFVALQPKSATVFAGVDGGALARSKDGGKTWEWVLDDLAQSPHPVAFDPANPKSVWLPDVNLHKRSADGGAKWTEFRISGGDVMTFAFHPKDSKTIWAGGVNGRSGLWRTSDGGASWKQIGKGLPEMNRVVRLIVDPGDPQNLYLAAFRGGYRSTDGGESWTPFGGGFAQSSEIESLAVTGPKTIYGGNEKGLFRSTDGGESWSEIGEGLPNYIVTALGVDPSSPEVMWAGTSGAGIYKSTDGGKSWAAANRGFAASWIKRVWGDAAGTVYAQTGLGLFKSDGRGGWITMLQPFSDEKADVDTIVFDPKNPSVVHAGDSWNYFRSTDGGATWKDVVKPFQNPRPVFTSVALDMKNPKVIYSADSNADDDEPAIFRSTDGGVKWKPAAKGVTSPVLRLTTDASGALVALGKTGSLWRSVDGATTWTSGGSGLPPEDLLDLAIDPTNPARVYVAAKAGLFRSEDSGETFSAAGTWKEDQVEDVAVDAKGNVYVGSGDGVSRSSDGGKTWTKFNDGLTNEDVRTLYCSGTRLYAGTAGGGVFSIGLE